MMYATKDRIRDNVPESLDRTSAGCVFPERNVSPHLIISAGIFRKDSSKVLDVEHEQMICALAPDQADQAFNISVLPGRAERWGPVPDPYRSDASLKRDAKCFVIVGTREHNQLKSRPHRSAAFSMSRSGVLNLTVAYARATQIGA
jgi:hypothetical protein